MGNVLHLDLETRSACDLKRAGLYAYAEHSSTDLICACYQFDDGPVHLWVPHWEIPEAMRADLRMRWGLEMGGVAHFGPDPPRDLVVHIKSGGQVRAHNAAFERRAFCDTIAKRYGLPRLEIGQMVCTMAKARVHGLQGGLDDACSNLGIEGKNKAGQNAMRKLCRPQTDGRFIEFLGAPQMFVDCYFYCGDDVKAEHRLDKSVPELTPAEQAVWELDQRINDRGIRVDTDRVKDAVHLVLTYKKELAGRCRAQTGLEPSQTGKLADWIRANGYESLTDLQVPTVNEAVKDPKCPDNVKNLLRLFSTHNMKAVTKFPAMITAQCLDEHLRGMFLYYGASTGRWASMIVQLQNMLRSLIKNPEVAISLLKHRDLALLRFYFDDIDPMKVLASCTRGMLIADPGHDLIALDFDQIEARIVAWLADALDIVTAFAAGEDVYKITAAKIFRKAVADVTPDERFLGKIAVLALGYQGGDAAFAKMAKNFGVDIDPILATRVKEDWRAANPTIVQLWYDIERAACAAVESPGQVFGAARKRLLFKVVDRWLYLRLPSGRRLAYFMPALNADGQVTYLGVDTYTRQWGRVKTYGGKLLQNAAEGIARDLLVAGLKRAEGKGYAPIGSVHDEGVFQVKQGFGSLAEVTDLMTVPLDWAKGLPVKAKGWRGREYRK